MDDSRAIFPIAISFILMLAIVAAWGLTLFVSGVPSAYGWGVLVRFTLPVAGILGLIATVGFFVWKRKELSWTLVAIALSLTAAWPALWPLGIAEIAYPADPGDVIPSATVRLPSDETLRVLWGGNDLATNVHAKTPDQRWAYDFVVEPAYHGARTLDEYGCFGTAVLAPDSGTVVSVVNDQPDHLPGEIGEFSTPFGNHVAIGIEGQTYLVLAHLKQGSVTVSVGDHVNEGQKIGECGNSGASEEPRIHVHHQRENPAETLPGFAEGLPLYFRNHDGDKMPSGGILFSDGQASKLEGDAVRHVR